MASFRVETRFPSIIIHTIEGTLSDAELDDYVREGTAVFLRSSAHVTILDLTRMGTASAYARSRSVGWYKQYRAQLTTSCLGIAYVIPSPLLRFISMTVQVLVELPMPYAVFQTQEEAVAWAQQRLSADR